jgi:PAS domain S-box-containing protein
LLFQQSLAAIYTTTVDGRMLDCNEAMVDLLGYKSRADLMSLPSSKLYVTPAERRDFLRRLRKNGKLANAECRLKRKDGTPIHVLENVSLLPDQSGKLKIIHGNMVDITERKHAEEALRQSEQAHRSLTHELRRLADRQEAVREGERARIARELNDEFGQALTALNMDLHWLASRTREGKPEVHSRIEALARLVGKTAETLHRICADLRPTVLDDFGLIAAIEWEAREFQRRTGISCKGRLPRGIRCPLPKEQATAVFRIFQESLTNVARHAHASEASVMLKLRKGVLTMAISDNGRGITPSQASDARSLGLAGMRERTRAWRGQLEFSGSRAKGTTVTLRMPVAPGGKELRA